MKKIYKLLALSLLLIATTSCGDEWLNTVPSDSVPADDAITTYKAASVALTGVYDGLQGASNRVSYYGARMFYYGDVRADDMQARDQGMRTSATYEMRYVEDNAPNMWNVPYNVIRRANKLIEAIEEDKIADATEVQLAQLEAEALVIRALVHFDLVRLYGNPYTMDGGASLGVPIVTIPLPMDALPERSTVADVYTQVLKDLNDAIASNGLSDKENYGYVNTWFAKGLLAKVNLYKGDNVAALKHAEDVIEKSPYQLWTNEEYVDGWNTSDKGRKEMLFEIVNASSDDWTDREGIAYLMHEDGYADMIATQSFLDLIESDPLDVRNKILIPAVKDEGLIKKFGDAKIFVNKFPADVSGDMRLNSLPVMRLSEVYLIAAEAAAKQPNAIKAAKYLNEIVSRANPDANRVSPADATVERVLLERRKELIGEGERFFDAMRNNVTIVRYTDIDDRGFHYPLLEESQKFDRTYFRTILPIPLSEINVNPNIKDQQNPGY